VTVTLRPWEPGDVDAVMACIDDEILHWIPMIPRPYERSHAEAFITDPPDGIGRAVLVDGEVAGSIGLTPTMSEGGHVGYWCGPQARGRGVMTDSLRQFCGYALDGLQLRRLELIVDPDNVASQRVAEKVGFQREGVLRSHLAHPDGRRRDSVMYSLLPGELRGA
jgi:RimJ/RimL family protein N-acetyltransferase